MRGGGEEVLDVDVGVVSLRGVCVLPFECRPGGGVLGRANPGEVVGLAFCSRCGRWMLVGAVLLEELDDVVFPAFVLSTVLSLSALSWVLSWLPVECAPRPPGGVMVSNPRRHTPRLLSVNRLPCCDLVVLYELLSTPCCSLNVLDP